ncbi:hypothetical protein PFISCL1PPCAC_9448, partial [Pristionchus fissidentatus]
HLDSSRCLRALSLFLSTTSCPISTTVARECSARNRSHPPMRGTRILKPILPSVPMCTTAPRFMIGRSGLYEEAVNTVINLAPAKKLNPFI